MHRLSLLAALLHPSQLRDALRPHRGGPSTRDALGGALRCGASVALAFLAVAALGRQDLAGYASLGALASLYGRSSGYAWRLRLMAVVGAALATAVAATSALAAAHAPVVAELAVLTLLAAGATAGAVALRTGPPGATILVFAAGAGTAAASDAADVAARALAVAGGAVVACLVCTGGRVVDRGPRAAEPAPRVRDVVRAGTAGGAALAPTASVAVAAALAGSVAAAAGWGHPAWAVMGAAAVLQGAHVRHMGVRALQRAAGTAAGVAIALPLLGADLPFWAVAALVVVLQTATELVVARHYGVAMLTITPMALLMTSLGAPLDPARLALDRALDTAAGAVVGLLVAVVAARPEHAGPVAPATAGTPAVPTTPRPGHSPAAASPAAH
ncbi:FUSC family protein [Cellulomonas pakistanensis]|uniref:Integral membrane bound transporter domain-containing protein n=1 Tax=Cellulomonas pakistanensis TaxID=992287 RepID=A0A919PD01_9CELL|nr:FUSC family protein [Cellulomonas pakistanensis]GIG37918.1 hypothetical protein Cpa01nite_32990 [Cellulomonas pakistanensis]